MDCMSGFLRVLRGEAWTTTARSASESSMSHHVVCVWLRVRALDHVPCPITRDSDDSTDTERRSVPQVHENSISTCLGALGPPLSHGQPIELRGHHRRLAGVCIVL